MSDLTTFLAEFVQSLKNLGEEKAKYEQERIIYGQSGEPILIKDGRLQSILPHAIKMTGLDGLLNYWSELGLGEKGLFGCYPQAVTLMKSNAATSTLGEVLTFAQAVPVTADLSFIGRQMSQEDAVIRIKTSFIYDTAAAELLAALGTLVLDESVQTDDDGVSQRVTAKSGITMAHKIQLGSVTLRPYETFPEIQDKIPGRLYNVRVTKEGAAANIAIHASRDPSVDHAISLAIKDYLVAGLIERGVDDAQARRMVLV